MKQWTPEKVASASGAEVHPGSAAAAAAAAAGDADLPGRLGYSRDGDLPRSAATSTTAAAAAG
jgi:hypothetical protein